MTYNMLQAPGLLFHVFLGFILGKSAANSDVNGGIGYGILGCGSELQKMRQFSTHRIVHIASLADLLC